MLLKKILVQRRSNRWPRTSYIVSILILCASKKHINAFRPWLICKKGKSEMISFRIDCVGYKTSKNWTPSRSRLNAEKKSKEGACNFSVKRKKSRRISRIMLGKGWQRLDFFFGFIWTGLNAGSKRGENRSQALYLLRRGGDTDRYRFLRCDLEGGGQKWRGYLSTGRSLCNSPRAGAADPVVFVY